MRVPHSPHNLRRVVKASKSSDEEESGSESPSKSKILKSSRPPRPATYTSKGKDGKYTVGLAEKNNNSMQQVQNEAKGGSTEQKTSAAAESPIAAAAATSGFHRSRERTRVSAVQRLVERKLAQKEKEKLKQREKDDKNRVLTSTTKRSASTHGCCEENGKFVRSRRTDQENEYLASLLLRTSRSCERPVAEDAAKTYITITAGKPARIREHSPSKKASRRNSVGSSSGNSSNSGYSSSEDEAPSKTAKLKDNPPLKSTGLFREFTFINENLERPDKQRKTSFTTERTFVVNPPPTTTETRRISVDVSYSSKTPTSDSSTPTPNPQKRCNNSPNFSTSSSTSSGFSSSSSNLSSSSSGSNSSSSSSTDISSIGSQSDKDLSRRRISLEQRFRARTVKPTVFPSENKPEPQPRLRQRKSSSRLAAAASAAAELAALHRESIEEEAEVKGPQLGSGGGYRFHKTTTVQGVATGFKFSSVQRKFSQNDLNSQPRPPRASRKISLPSKSDIQEQPEEAISEDLTAWSFHKDNSIERWAIGGEGDESSMMHPKLVLGYKLREDPSGSDLLHDYFEDDEEPTSLSNATFLSPSSPNYQSNANIVKLSSINDEFVTDKRKESSRSAHHTNKASGSSCRSKRSTSPPSRNVTPVRNSSKQLDTNSSQDSPLLKLHRLKEKAAGGKNKAMDKSYDNTIDSKSSLTSYEDDLQSVSTISGSGIDFFRKFVKKQTTKGNNKQSCKDCETQFRRQVLIDRLVSDTILTKAWLAGGGPPPSQLAREIVSETEETSTLQETVAETMISRAELNSICEASCSSRCAAHQEILDEDQRSEIEDALSTISSSRSSVSLSTISGSGLLFLRNYMKKKKSRDQQKGRHSEPKPPPLNQTKQQVMSQFFNSVPVPFPPKDEFYGPSYVLPDHVVFDPDTRRQSVGSTIADLLCDSDADSELQNLDWSDWEDDDQLAPQDIQNYYELLQDIESLRLPPSDPIPEEDDDDEGRVTVLPCEGTPTAGSALGFDRQQFSSSANLPSSYNPSPVFELQNRSSRAVKRNISRCQSGQLNDTFSPQQKDSYLSPNLIGSPKESTPLFKSPQKVLAFSPASVASPDDGSTKYYSFMSPQKTPAETPKSIHDVFTPPLAISSPFGPSLDAKKADSSPLFSIAHEATIKSLKSTKLNLPTTSDHSSLASLLSRNSGDSADLNHSLSPSSKSEAGVEDQGSGKLSDKFSSFDDLTRPTFSREFVRKNSGGQTPSKHSGAIPKDRSRVHSSSSEDNNRSSASSRKKGSGQVTPFDAADEIMHQPSKRRLADFWEKTVLAGTNEEHEMDFSEGFKPVLKSYYDPDTSVNSDRVKRFIEATRKTDSSSSYFPPNHSKTNSSSSESLNVPPPTRTGIRIKRNSSSSIKDLLNSDNVLTPF